MKDTTVQNNALHRAQDYGLSRRNLLLATTSLAAASAVPAAATAQTQKKPAARQNRIIINLSASWKFATDSGNIGQSQGWFSDSFDDSAWQTLLSGKSWESQNINYSGYAWYRRIVSLPGTVAGMPLKITLGSIYSDDDFYFNGVRIGGLKGEYKYSNLIARQYTIPASLVRAGAANTLAIRIWGGSISGQLKKSGLVSGTYSIVADNIRLHGRAVSGSDNSEVPIEIFDLSGAQQGSAW